jgi:hypothetical protein
MRFVQSYCPPSVTQWSLRSMTCLMERGLWTSESLGSNLAGESGGWEKKEEPVADWDEG